VAPGSQTPLSPVQGPYAQVLSELQKRVVVPQAPHATVSLVPGSSHGSGPASVAPASVPASLGVGAPSIAITPPSRCGGGPLSVPLIGRLSQALRRESSTRARVARSKHIETSQ
jgi:hypothetical protein